MGVVQPTLRPSPSELSPTSERNPRALTGDPRQEQLDVLHGICHALGSARDMEELLPSTIRWVQEAVGGQSISVVVSLADAHGRLHEAAVEGEKQLGRRRSGRRRSVFETKRPQVAALRATERVVAHIPLVTRGLSVGVLEVAAERSVIEERWDVLRSIASQTAIAIRNLQDRTASDRKIEGLERSAGILDEILRAKTADAAIRAAMAYCWERSSAPVAGWVSLKPGEPFVLVGTEGLSGSSRSRLATHIPVLARDGHPTLAWRKHVAERFRRTLAVEAATVLGAGPAVVVVGQAESRDLVPLGSLLGVVLEHLNVIQLAERRNEDLDSGLAWTAHEMRRPLLGARAAIDQILPSVDNVDDRQRIEQARRELDLLSQDLDSLLRYAVGERPIRRRHTDLMGIIRAAIVASGFEGAVDRVRIRGPERVPVLADRTHLRTAILNVIRNALEYSQGPVVVTVEEGSDLVTINVLDEGPGISPDDRDSIFDPFVRASAGGRGGSGLGLFISRRVVEAHRGGIWVDPVSRGASFTLRLPAISGDRQTGVARSGS